MRELNLKFKISPIIKLCEFSGKFRRLEVVAHRQRLLRNLLHTTSSRLSCQTRQTWNWAGERIHRDCPDLPLLRRDYSLLRFRLHQSCLRVYQNLWRTAKPQAGDVSWRILPRDRTKTSWFQRRLPLSKIDRGNLQWNEASRKHHQRQHFGQKLTKNSANIFLVQTRFSFVRCLRRRAGCTAGLWWVSPQKS